MENRFGVKDFFLFTLVAVLICVVGLSIWQSDRQWDSIKAVDSKLDERFRAIDQRAAKQLTSIDNVQRSLEKQSQALATVQKMTVDATQFQTAAVQTQTASLQAQTATLQGQAAEIASIREQLNRGVAVATPAGPNDKGNQGGNAGASNTTAENGPGTNRAVAVSSAPVKGNQPGVMVAPPISGSTALPTGSTNTPTTVPSVAVIPQPTTIPSTPVVTAPYPTTGPTVIVANTTDDPFLRVKAAAAMPGYAQGDWLVESAPNSDRLTPLVSGDQFASVVQGHVLESLVTRDPGTLEWIPVLARTGWVVTDNVAAYQMYRAARTNAGVTPDDFAKDPNRPVPITVKFQLRPNVAFSDGQPMTADDIVWTFNWIMNPAVDAARARAYYTKIKRVVKTGDDEVTFEFNEPYYDPVGLSGGMTILPAHWYQNFSPTEFNKNPCLLMGSGPYKLPKPDGWTPGADVTLVRNDQYWGEPSGFDRLVYRIMLADLPRLTAFKNGELDDFSPTSEQYQSLIKNPEITGRTNHFEYDTPTAGYRFIAWNQSRNGKPTPFADKRVRQAMTMLTDRQRMCDEVEFGLANIATGPFNRLGKQNDASIQPWPYDVERAKKLLAEAGYKDDGSGQIVGPDGQPLKFTFTYPAGSGPSDRITIMLKNSFAKAGVTMEPERLDWSAFREKLKKREFDVITLGWTAGLETDLYQIFDSAGIKDEGDDFVSYKNPKLDALIEQARETVDENKRMALWKQCHAIIHEDQPYTFLYTRRSLEFTASRIHNTQKVKVGLNPADEWFVPTDQQRPQQ